MSSLRSSSIVRIVLPVIAVLSLTGCIFGTGSAPDPEVLRPYEAPPEEQLETSELSAPPRAVEPRNGGPMMAAGEASKPEARWGDPYWKPGDAGPGPGTLAIGKRLHSGVPLETGWVRQHDWVGDGSAETEPFRVETSWKLVWRSGDRASDDPLRMEVYRESDGALMARVTQDGASETSSLQLPEPGAYYVRIAGGGGQWYVAVEVPAPGSP